MYTCMDMIKYMWHIGSQPVYITFIAFYLYLEYVGWFSTCITILAVQMDTETACRCQGAVTSEMWNHLLMWK